MEREFIRKSEEKNVVCFFALLLSPCFEQLGKSMTFLLDSKSLKINSIQIFVIITIFNLGFFSLGASL